MPVPGFSWLGKNIGIKDDTPDFAVAFSRVPCSAAGVFTRNNFPGAPVIVGREHLRGSHLQAIVVNSKNANVATGPDGIEDARRMCRAIGAALGIEPRLVLPSSTGVIGRPLPIARIEAACREARDELQEAPEALERFARAIMTTDTRPKWTSRRIGPATLSAVAKGSGMIEPNMATMLSYFFTDAALEPAALQDVLNRAVNRSFNRVSVDTDTSTSDTVVVMANGQAGPVEPAAFEEAFTDAAIELAQAIARDGEGATRLVEITCCEAPSQAAALAIAKAVVNSPLVKTAIHGADPNWGRFVMAVGKVFEHPVPLEALRIEFATPGGPLTIAAERLDEAALQRISDYLRGETVQIRIRLGQGQHAETVWGCDLSEGYVHINADYTT
ncbi:MAG TPA: bifunctional glutamate N-acetyltransferase/amino-acid acetyltransferase ArgJ [bacterium]|nr:bifunctional glutamate N-acetyltransferase/amino-acid acetyltransferase ArgJ [bacterium]